MRYSDEVIEEVRQRNDIVDVIGSYVKLTKKGRDYFGLCPFHNEKSPSFSVSSIKQMYYCFGCGKGGNVFSFIREYENESFQEALVTLAERAGITLPEKEESSESRRAAEYRSILLEIQKEAALFFYHQLKSDQGKQGYEYLKNRGLTDEVMKNFGLGYAPASKNLLYQYLKKKGYTDAQLKDSGLVRIEERGAYDKFWNRVMFPIMDINNHVIGFGGRVMGDGSPKYLNSPETMIFDKSRNLYGMNFARRTRRPYLLICEGYMDVIALHKAGFTNAVAALGTAFTDQHAALIRRYTKDVILTFDSDQAGIHAALRAIPIVRRAGLGVKILTMDPYKDPDEFIKNLGAEAYEKRIDSAVNAFLFEVKVLRDSFDFNDPAKRNDFISEVCRKLAEFTDELEQDSYIRAVAQDYGFEYRMLRNRVRSLPFQPETPAAPAQPAARRIRREKDQGIRTAQRMLLTWFAEDPSCWQKVSDVIEPEDFTDELYQKTAALLFEQLQKGRVNPAAILDRFEDDQESAGEVAKIFHTDLSGEATEDEKNRAFRECVIRVRRNSLQKACDNASDIAELQKLIQQQKALEQLKIDL